MFVKLFAFILTLGIPRKTCVFRALALFGKRCSWGFTKKTHVTLKKFTSIHSIFLRKRVRKSFENQCLKSYQNGLQHSKKTKYTFSQFRYASLTALGKLCPLTFLICRCSKMLCL